MSKTENNVFSYSVHFTVNITAWRMENPTVTLVSFLRLFTEAITPKRKDFFQNYMAKFVKIEEIREKIATSHIAT